MQAAWLYEWKCLSASVSPPLWSTPKSLLHSWSPADELGDTQVKTYIFQILKKLWINYKSPFVNISWKFQFVCLYIVAGLVR